MSDEAAQKVDWEAVVAEKTALWRRTVFEGVANRWPDMGVELMEGVAEMIVSHVDAAVETVRAVYQGRSFEMPEVRAAETPPELVRAMGVVTEKLTKDGRCVLCGNTMDTVHDEHCELYAVRRAVLVKVRTS